MKTCFQPLGTEHSHTITEKTDSGFLLLLRQGVLLGLKEGGYITQTQYRDADAALLRKFRQESGRGTDA